MGDTPDASIPTERDPDRLEGWKAIAGYFDRDIRTVQRWERTEGLPIRRHNHSRQASAYAIPRELAEWRKTRGGGVLPTREADAEAIPSSVESTSARYSRHRKSIVGLGGLALVLLCAVVAGAIVRNRATDHTTTHNQAATSAFVEGERLYRAGWWTESIEPLERATALDPEFALPWAILAKSYARSAQPGQLGKVMGSPASRSEEAANHALRLAPQVAASHLGAAMAARARRDVDQWRSEARRAIAIDPKTAEAYAVLADSYNALIQYSCSRDQNPALAETYYAQAVALDPMLPPDNRATNLRYMGRYAECVDLMSKALARRPGPPFALSTRGRCRLMEGDLDGAAADIEPLRHSRNTGSAGSFMDLGWLELRRGNIDEGVVDLEQAANIGDSALNELTVAYVYGDAGDSRRAIDHLQRGFALDSGCRRMVATGIAFQHLRTFAEVRTLLASVEPR